MTDIQRVVIDANIFLNVFVRGDRPASRASVDLMRAVHDGKYQLLVPAPVILEVFAITVDKTYSIEQGYKIIASIFSEPNVLCVEIKRPHIDAAMDLMARCNYQQIKGREGLVGRKNDPHCLSYTDSLVLAIGIGAQAIVCSDERLFQAFKDEAQVLRPSDLLNAA